MTMRAEEGERFHPESRAERAAWLAGHHDRSDEVVAGAVAATVGPDRLSYEEAVLEALCFGWIDGKSAGLDDDRTMLRFSPRQAGQLGLVEQAAGRAAAGRGADDRGRAGPDRGGRDGSWTRLDAVEDLVVPDDLAAALASHPGALENWDGFPRSVRRAALLSIVEAKRPETRARRVVETARLTARGERPGQYALSGAGAPAPRPAPAPTPTARPPSPGPRPPPGPACCR